MITTKQYSFNCNNIYSKRSRMKVRTKNNIRVFCMNKGKRRSFKQDCLYDNEGNAVKLLYGIYLSWNNIIMIATI
jgi:hypothetical protein